MTRRQTSLAIVVAAALAAACGPARGSTTYRAFVASHDALRTGMPLRDAFDAGLADYLTASGGKNIAGRTQSDKEPASADCRAHVLDVHYGPGDGTSGGGFRVRVYCNMNGPADRQIAPEGIFPTKRALVDGLAQYAAWTRSLTFNVSSPALRIGGVYDRYDFSTDTAGNITTISPIRLADN